MRKPIFVFSQFREISYEDCLYLDREPRERIWIGCQSQGACWYELRCVGYRGVFKRAERCVCCLNGVLGLWAVSALSIFGKGCIGSFY